MRIVVVGAGAVGQVFGRHLQLGGAEVAFKVKEKYAADAREGFTLYPLNEREPTRPRRFEGFEVLTTDAEVADGGFDAALLTISSTALRGDWLGPFLEAMGDKPVIMLQPGFTEREHVSSVRPEAVIVQGLIAFIAYPAPLPGETRFPGPGLAYWFPPLSPSPFAGPEPFTSELVGVLKEGGLPASVNAKAIAQAGYPAVALQTHIAALEAAGWTFEAFRRHDHQRVAAQAAKEGFAVVAHRQGERPPLATRFVSPIASTLALSVAQVAIPIDMETYLRVHFTKVGDQTRLHLDELVEEGERAGLPVGALRELRERLP